MLGAADLFSAFSDFAGVNEDDAVVNDYAVGAQDCEGVFEILRPGNNSVGLNAFTGDRYRSAAQSHYMHACKKARTEQIQHTQTKNDVAPLKDGFNLKSLRAGDTVDVGDSSIGNKSHPNAYRPAGVVKSAWLSCGKNHLDRQGIAGTHRGLACSSAVASGIVVTQDRYGRRTSPPPTCRAYMTLVTSDIDIVVVHVLVSHYICTHARISILQSIGSS